MKNWRKTREYRIWRVNVIRRDKKCKICGSIKKRHAHHIESGQYNPDLRFENNNGITMCYECHMNFHCNFKRSYRQKCSNYDLKNFKVLVNYIKEKFNEN